MSANNWSSLDSPSALTDFLFELSGQSQPTLGIISLDWHGCLACQVNSSPYVKLRESLPDRYLTRNINIQYGICTWRKSTAHDFSEPVHNSYKMLLYLLRTKSQKYEAGRIVETFTNLDDPDYWRPKFPQLFFIDGEAIDSNVLSKLSTALIDETLIHPYVGNMTDNSFFEYLKVHDAWLDPNEVLGARRALSADLNIAGSGSNNRKDLETCFDQSNSVLLQLTNYNLYKAPGDDPADFMTSEVYASCDCVVDRFESGASMPSTCAQFDRRNPRSTLPA